jgi:hypothetical protein
MTPKAEAIAFLRKSAMLRQAQNQLYFRSLALTRGKPVLPDRRKLRRAAMAGVREAA